MSKAIFAAATWLYSVAAPEGRLFEKGAEHPGEGWFDHPSAVPGKAQSVASDGTGKTLQDHIDEALAAQTKKFDEAWSKLSAEKKATDTENADLRRDIASRDEDIRQLGEKVKELEELIATVDGDGDGKPGGSAPKGDKAAK